MLTATNFEMNNQPFASDLAQLLLTEDPLCTLLAVTKGLSLKFSARSENTGLKYCYTTLPHSFTIGSS